MKNNEAILAALDALTIAVNANTRELQTIRELKSAQYKTQLNAAYALDINSAYPAEMLKVRYGSKPGAVNSETPVIEQCDVSARVNGSKIRCQRLFIEHQIHHYAIPGGMVFEW